MERQAYGQRNGEHGYVHIRAAQVKEVYDIVCKEVVVLKNGQHTYVGYQAHDEEPLSLLPLRILYKYARKVIYDNGGKENEDVNRNEVHVKDATCYQQMKPAELVRQQEEQNSNYREE
jgi:hypothetical protein